MARIDAADRRRLIGREPGQTARLMVYLLFAIVLMAMDQRGQYVPRVRALLGSLLEPVFYFVDGPSRVMRSVRDYSRSLSELRAENERLSDTLLRQAGETQRLGALQQENARLRALLDAATGRDFDYEFAAMVQVNLDPFSHQVMIDHGSRDGVFEGQAVIDGAGVIGQVESVMWHLAQVRLISDPDHALPVQINRTGLRTVAFGTGSADALVLPNVPLQADVREGDLLETSGLGERFPPGFPVARVTAVEREEGGMFARVTAAPLAALDRGREVLLVVPRAGDSGAAGQPAPAETTDDTETIETAPPASTASGEDAGEEPE